MNLKLKKVFFILLMLNLFSFHEVYSGFLDTGYSSRIMGLGGSFVAIAEGPAGMGYNPALSLTDRLEVIFNQSFPIVGVHRSSVGNSGNLWNSYLGILTRVYKKFFLGFGWSSLFATEIYNEHIITLNGSYGFDFSNKLFKSFRIGVSFNYLLQNYKGNAYIESFLKNYGSTATGISIDIGCLVELLSGFNLGISYKNLFGNKIGIYYEEYVPRILRAGLMLDLAYIENVGKRFDRLIISVDFSLLDEVYNFHFGSEMSFRKIFTVRIGFDFHRLSAGFGLNIRDRFYFDYGLRIPIVKVLHLFLEQSLSISFNL